MKKKKDEWENMRVNREDDGGRVRAQRVMEWHKKKKNRVRDRQLCESVGHFSETPSVLPSKDYKLMFPPPGPRFQNTTPIEILEFWFLRNVYRSRVCVCVSEWRQ